MLKSVWNRQQQSRKEGALTFVFLWANINPEALKPESLQELDGTTFCIHQPVASNRGTIWVQTTSQLNVGLNSHCFVSVLSRISEKAQTPQRVSAASSEPFDSRSGAALRAGRSETSAHSVSPDQQQLDCRARPAQRDALWSERGDQQAPAMAAEWVLLLLCG